MGNHGDQIVAAVFASAGLLLFAMGVAVVRGRLGLLASYEPGAVDDERRVARHAGGSLALLGLVTVGVGLVVLVGRIDSEYLRVTGGWMAMVVAASGYSEAVVRGWL